MAKVESRSLLECNALQGDSPVDELTMLFSNRVGPPRSEV